MIRHSPDDNPIASSMLNGASSGRFPLSCEKKAMNGTLIPECSSTPADANSSISHTTNNPGPDSAAVMIIVFDV